jgi:hypothetical protein
LCCVEVVSKQFPTLHYFNSVHATFERHCSPFGYAIEAEP